MEARAHPKDFVEYEDLDAPGNPFYRKDLTRLVFEITERFYLKHADRIQSIIRFLRGFGVGIALDDLGSGYSSLEVLTTLAPDYVKIDMSLVRNLYENDRKRKMMKALLYYCGEIDARCVAEGVETREGRLPLPEPRPSHRAAASDAAVIERRPRTPPSRERRAKVPRPRVSAGANRESASPSSPSPFRGA